MGSPTARQGERVDAKHGHCTVRKKAPTARTLPSTAGLRTVGSKALTTDGAGIGSPVGLLGSGTVSDMTSVTSRCAAVTPCQMGSETE